MTDRFKKLMHKRCGVGGIHCYCCNMYKGKFRRKLNKLARTELKRQDKLNHKE